MRLSISPHELHNQSNPYQGRMVLESDGRVSVELGGDEGLRALLPHVRNSYRDKENFAVPRSFALPGKAAGPSCSLAGTLR